MRHFTAIILAGSTVLALTLPCNSRGQMMGSGPMMGQMMQGSMYRHHFYMMHGIDARYRNKSNPLPTTPGNLQVGQRLFRENCAACHGAKGLGDGAAGKNLLPRPANIAAMSKMPMASDAYLFWTISEGGAQFGSEMPAFGQRLREDEIWAIITYVRTL